MTARASQSHAITATPAPEHRSLGQKTAWSALASITMTAAAALSSIIVARVLGPSGTGEVAYSQWLSLSAASVFAFGYPQTIARFSAELDGARRAHEMEGVARGLVRRALVSLTLGIVAIVIVEMFVRRGARPRPSVVALAVALYLGQALVALYTAVLAGRQEFKKTSRLNFASAAVQLLGVAGGAGFGGIPGAIVGYVAGTVIPAVACLRFAAGEVVAPSVEMRARMRAYSFHTWIAVTMSLILWSRTEIFFLERWWGSHEVAMFTVGLTLAQLATQGPLLLGSALVPHFSLLAGAGDSTRIGSTYAALTRVLAFLLFPLCLLLAAASPVVIPALFGPAFRGASTSATVLVAAASMGATASAGTSVMYAMEHARFVAVSGTVGAVAGVIVFAVAIGGSGVVGAVWGRSVLQLALLAWSHWYLRRILRVPVPFWEVGLIALCAAVAAAPVAVAARIGCGIPGVSVAILAGLAAYITGIRLTGCLRPTDLAGVGRLVERVAPFARRWIDTGCNWVTGGSGRVGRVLR